MKTIRARSSINTKPEHVFKVLTDFDTYREWNTWLKNVKGQAQEGAQVMAKPNVVSLFGFRLCYRLVKIQPPDFMLWEEVAWFSPLFRTTREYQIYTKAGGGTIYSISLRFYGPLAPIVNRIYGKTVSRGLKRAADSLKLYCENKYPMARTERNKKINAYSPNHSSPNLDIIKL